ncbi:DNA phosphorothioation-dependent restriction protein DptG [Alkalibacillus aidingensis]|uniref:DNA phosphorothioation-dependent restriction protein DptG n=1 Tax=Alkalibacillus aidingensis TaxID=2747607 RepID=UPI0016601EF9|nr:DNA phosphorothioation-dependent restriction protein DptG [Alkalibacillus aidingensis]
MPELYKDYLKTLLSKKEKHNEGLAIDALPFLSKRTRAIRGRFNKVLGDYVRNICNLQLDTSTLSDQVFYSSDHDHIFSHHIAEQVEFNNYDDQDDFKRFLNQYLFNNEDIKLIHPYLFNYIKVEGKNKNEFSKYAKFMTDTLVEEQGKLQSIFSKKETEDIITELVLSRLDILKSTKAKKRQYMPLLNPIANLYQEDVLYLSKYKDYFLTAFPLITHYYVFMYACQLVVKFEQFTEANYEQLDPLYFSLEWESLSKRRKAAGELESFKFIKGKLVNLFPHIHTLSQLSHNRANTNEEEIDQRKEIDLLTYSDLKRLVNDGELDEGQFLNDLEGWMEEYKEIFKVNRKIVANNLEEHFKGLFDCLKEGTSTDVSKKFGGNIEDLGVDQFIKSRGSLGQVFNIKHDFLLLLTAVSVKENRIPLNVLFSEFEKRGIRLDNNSKQEVVGLLDNLNILDKKSDSGDAQYVKPIL